MAAAIQVYDTSPAAIRALVYGPDDRRGHTLTWSQARLAYGMGETA